jgi:hypothetical protein
MFLAISIVHFDIDDVNLNITVLGARQKTG